MAGSRFPWVFRGIQEGIILGEPRRMRWQTPGCFRKGIF